MMQLATEIQVQTLSHVKILYLFDLDVTLWISAVYRNNLVDRIFPDAILAALRPLQEVYVHLDLRNHRPANRDAFLNSDKWRHLAQVLRHDTVEGPVTPVTRLELTLGISDTDALPRVVDSLSSRLGRQLEIGFDEWYRSGGWHGRKDTGWTPDSRVSLRIDLSTLHSEDFEWKPAPVLHNCLRHTGLPLSQLNLCLPYWEPSQVYRCLEQCQSTLRTLCLSGDQPWILETTSSSLIFAKLIKLEVIRTRLGSFGSLVKNWHLPNLQYVFYSLDSSDVVSDLTSPAMEGFLNRSQAIQTFSMERRCDQSLWAVDYESWQKAQTFLQARHIRLYIDYFEHSARSARRAITAPSPAMLASATLAPCFRTLHVELRSCSHWPPSRSESRCYTNLQKLKIGLPRGDDTFPANPFEPLFALLLECHLPALEVIDLSSLCPTWRDLLASFLDSLVLLLPMLPSLVHIVLDRRTLEAEVASAGFVQTCDKRGVVVSDTLPISLY